MQHGQGRKCLNECTVYVFYEQNVLPCRTKALAGLVPAHLIMVFNSATMASSAGCKKLSRSRHLPWHRPGWALAVHRERPLLERTWDKPEAATHGFGIRAA